MKLKVLELFAGIGTQRMALRNIGVNHEVIAIAEIDKFAINSYESIHDDDNHKTVNLFDVSKITEDELKKYNLNECDLLTYSFPCTDISVAGQQMGFEKGSGTSSSLLWECERIIRRFKPKYLLMENVKNLVGKKFKQGFDEWLEILSDMGYTNYWQVLSGRVK
ncbi:TPA: DNA (cytosine-5-)-methyltransferase [Streptococcus suis]